MHTVVSSQELEFKSKCVQLLYFQDVSDAVEPSSQSTVSQVHSRDLLR